MSIPDDDDLPPGRYGLSRRETFIRKHAINFLSHPGKLRTCTPAILKS